jgi:hypothetical protein
MERATRGRVYNRGFGVSIADYSGEADRSRQLEAMKKIVNYQSDITRFIGEFLDRNPQVADKQKRHRATWWDRPQDLAERARLDQATLAQPAYVYYDKP